MCVCVSVQARKYVQCRGQANNSMYRIRTYYVYTVEKCWPFSFFIPSPFSRRRRTPPLRERIYIQQANKFSACRVTTSRRPLGAAVFPFLFSLNNNHNISLLNKERIAKENENKPPVMFEIEWNIRIGQIVQTRHAKASTVTFFSFKIKSRKVKNGENDAIISNSSGDTIS